MRQRATWLPWDDEAERAAIGALLLAPQVHAKRLARRLFEGHFFLEAHGWLWARVSWALCQQKLDLGTQLDYWLAREQIVQTYRAKYGSVAAEVHRCLEAGFWWNGDYYCDRVLAAAKCRARIVKAGEDLEAAIEAAEAGRLKGYWK